MASSYNISLVTLLTTPMMQSIAMTDRHDGSGNGNVDLSVLPMDTTTHVGSSVTRTHNLSVTRRTMYPLYHEIISSQK